MGNLRRALKVVALVVGVGPENGYLTVIQVALSTRVTWKPSLVSSCSPVSRATHGWILR